MSKFVEVVKRSWWVEDVMLRPWFLKLILLIILTFVLGLPQACYKMFREDMARNSNISFEERMKREKILDVYFSEKLNQAKEKDQKIGGYTAIDYFADLKDIHIKEKEVGGQVNPWRINGELQEISRKNLKTKKDWAALEKAREDYKEFIDPARESSEKARAEMITLGPIGILKWFAKLYLVILPWAFFWLLVVAYQIYDDERWKKEKEFIFPNPWRFVLLLIFYPVFFIWNIWVTMKKESINFVARAEILRTKINLFGSLSEEELQRLKNFRENNLSLSVWRQQLKALGLKPRHGLAAAMAATLLISFIPNLAQAETKAKTKSFLPETAWEQVVDQGQHLARMSISSDNQSQNNAGQQDVGFLIFEPFNLQVVLSCSFNKIQKKLLRLKEFCRHIDHVPIFSVIQCEVNVLNLITE